MSKNSVTIRATPSLALIKYWGKLNSSENLPATSSLAVNLDGCVSETTVSLAEARDTVSVNGEIQPLERFRPFFDFARNKLGTDSFFNAVSSTNFPVAAGLASSSSGFAALAYGCAALIRPDIPQETLSDIARIGSASAARAVVGGFSALRQGRRTAEKLFSSKHWPQLRVIATIVQSTAKETSSRTAMELVKTTSPYYRIWTERSEGIFENAVAACKNKDLERLGELMQESYLGMFATMFTSKPAIHYWRPETVSLIHLCQELRKKGFGAWETMDAGPQVKIVCLAEDVDTILKAVSGIGETAIVSKPAEGPVQV